MVDQPQVVALALDVDLPLVVDQPLVADRPQVVEQPQIVHQPLVVQSEHVQQQRYCLLQASHAQTFQLRFVCWACRAGWAAPAC